MAKRRWGYGIAAIGVGLALAVAGCGAGSRTGTSTAAKTACDFEAPAQATTVNVLAYNSSAVDPFTNAMVTNCSTNNVTVKHDPIDFGGQVQKTVATLSGAKGTYDIIETYSYVIPTYSAQGKLQPLDDLFAKYKDKYKLGDINEDMRKRMTYDGKLYGLPMQAQVFVMAYRKDVFDKLGLTPPKTFDELRTVSKKIQDAGEIKRPLALPWLASADIVTGYGAALTSMGGQYVDPKTKEANFTSDKSKKALEEMKSLLPYMDPQVTTFDQPKVQQQLFNGSAAIGIMFSGRMIDLTESKNTKYSDQFAFAAPPAVLNAGDKQYSSLSVDGWSLPKNTPIAADLLFQIIATSVNEDVSKAAIPAAYPARNGLVTDENTPYGAAANDAIAHVPDPQPYPYVPPITDEITPIVAKVITGRQSIDDGTKQMQAAAEKILANH